MIGYCETKQFDGNSWYSPPLFSLIFFRYQIFRQTQKWSSTNFLRTMIQNFLTEKRDNLSIPPSHFFVIFFDTRIFVEHRRVPLRSLSLLWNNKLFMEDRGKICSSRNLSIPEFNDNNGFPYEVFRYSETTKPSIEIRYILFLGIKFFDTRNFLKHRRILLPNDSVLLDKIFRRKIVILAPLIPNIFRFQKFCETQKGSSTKFFGTVRRQISYGKSWHNLLKHNFFDTLF